MSYAIDLSTHGRELKEAFDRVVSSDPGTNWAIFNYDVPTQSLGPGSEDATSLDDFIDSFSDSKIQYGFARVEFNTIYKVIFVGWVGESVPDRIKGYFNAHFTTIGKFFTGYHVQITARDREDLTPAIVLRKIDQAAGSKYVAGSAKPTPSTKPKYVAAKDGAAEDDWGETKPVEVRDEPVLNNTSSTYKPTKVDRAAVTAGSSVDSPSTGSRVEGLDSGSGYKPHGKVDIKALREAGKNDRFADTKVEKIESSYKPYGKVDIAALRATAKKQEENKASASAFARSEPKNKEPEEEEEDVVVKPSASRSAFGARSAASSAPAATDDDDDEPKFNSLADRIKAFNSGVKSARPNASASSSVARKSAPFSKSASSGASSGTKPPAVGNAGLSAQAAGGLKDYALTDGKSPAQLWAEKRGKFTSTGPAETVSSNKPEEDVEEEDVKPVSNLRNKFAETSVKDEEEDAPKGAAPSFADITSRFAKSAPKSEPAAPSLPTRSIPEPEEEPETPKLPNRSVPAAPAAEEDAELGLVAIVEVDYEKAEGEDDEISLISGEKVIQIEKVDEFWWLGTNAQGESGMFPAEYVRIITEEVIEVVPSLPSRPQAPVEKEEAPAPPPPARPAAPVEEEPQDEAGPSAIAEFDYEAADEDELGFKEGDKITGIEFASDDWWSGVLNGKAGLFPANHVKLL